MEAEPVLDPQTLVWAYASGIFPMADAQTGEVRWFHANPRGVIFLDKFRCPGSLARRYRSGRFRLTQNRCFAQVIAECAKAPRDQESTWISPEIITGYTKLHQIGAAHSIEAWLPVDSPIPVRDPDSAHVEQLENADQTPHRLVGGLYGVHLGGVFFGESMFHRATDASRVALVHLIQHLKRQHFALLEIQAVNRHTAQFGAESIPQAEYEHLLLDGLKRPATW